MQKRFLIYLLIVVNSICMAQSNLNTEMLQLQENNYLHFNKDYYYAGERVWFQAYLLYAVPKWQDSLSKVLIADFVSPQNKTIKSLKYKIENGIAFGDFRLADSLQAGDYFLRVYTNWMRNYGDSTLQYYPIRIIDNNKTPVSQSINFKNCDYLLGINDTLKLGKNYSLQITIPNLKAYSLVMVDTFAVKRLNSKYENKICASFQNSKIDIINYPVDRELNVNGKILTGKKKKKSILFKALRKSNNEITEGETDEKGNFYYNWDGQTNFDELIIYVDKNIEVTFETNTLKPILKNISELPPLVFEKHLINENIKDTLEKDAKLLNEVIVKSKKTADKLNDIGRLYGKPDYVVKGEEIANAQVDNPLVALQGRVPGLTVLYINNKMFIDIRGSSKTSFRGEIQNPEILVDGFPFGASDLNDLAAISPKNVLKIEVVKRLNVIMGTKGSSGIINIITKSQANEEENNGTNTFKIPLIGYEKPHKYVPSEIQPIWQTNSNATNHSINIEVLPTKATTYLFEIVGILTNGNLIKCNKYLVCE